MVTRIDRLARSIGDLQDIVRAVKARGGLQFDDDATPDSFGLDQTFCAPDALI
jgi:hypothetical protein